MRTVIGSQQVVAISSAREAFAMVIGSQEYAEMQQNFFDVLWRVSKAGDVDDSGAP